MENFLLQHNGGTRNEKKTSFTKNRRYIKYLSSISIIIYSSVLSPQNNKDKNFEWVYFDTTDTRHFYE
jgi:hypothetical protein